MKENEEMISSFQVTTNESEMKTPTTLQTISWQAIQLGELIGSGGYGDVYKGKWQGSEVAVKKLQLKTLSSELKESFDQETQLMAKCHAPQIVRLFGVCMEVGHYAMVMEYLPRGSLYDVLQDKSISLLWVPTRWQIAIDIGYGLSYLHQQHIVHQDLKSLNVLLDKDFRAKISDFGLSHVKETTRSTTSVHSKKSTAGSTRWTAPELMSLDEEEGVPKSTYASDVYSYGIILWEIASRTLPFSGAKNEMIVMNWIIQGKKDKIPADTPECVKQWIEKCRSQNPTDRPTAQAVAEGLQTAFQLTQKPTQITTEKSWHFDPETKAAVKIPDKTPYILLQASPKDVEKVKQLYGHHPVPGMVISEDEMRVIYNPNLNRSFSLRLALLQERDNSKAFQPKWAEENQTTEQKTQRAQVDELAKNLAHPYRDSDYPAVKILPVWHGTKPVVLESLLKTGYANLATTDSGYFGKGIYGSWEAEYAYRVYSEGTLILNFGAFFSAYPVIKGDMAKLEGKSNYQNYDAHFAPVVPANPNNANEKVYFPCAPNQKHTYIEVVFFESSQIVPRCVVKLRPGMPLAPSNLLTKEQTEKKEGKEEKVKSSLYQSPGSEKKPNYSYQSPQTQPGEKLYREGKDCLVASQYTKALYSFEEAAKQNYPAAYLHLAWLYEVGGRVGPRDEIKSSIWYQKVAQSINWFAAQVETGDADAQTNLGVCYQKGVGVKQDHFETVKWYQKAAEQEYAPAQNYLGVCYDNGLGVKQDLFEAVKWYQKAAKQGYAAAQCNLGSCYHGGQGVKQDHLEAVKWYQKAAEQGYGSAQYNLGVCYKQGLGVKQDHFETVKWYQKAAEQGYAPAQNGLGACYDNEQGVKQDRFEAVRWYQKAAEQGYAAAQNNLGVCYQMGQGVKQDYLEAVRWYQKAAVQGFEKAQNGLKTLLDNHLYLKGYADAQNDLKALFDAPYNTCSLYLPNQGGKLYQEGMKYFIGAQFLKALPYFEEAAKQNYPAAYLRLSGLYGKDGRIGPKDEAKSQIWSHKVAQSSPWFEAQAKTGDADAQYNWGICCENGYGVKQDYLEAIRWYQKAAEQGYAAAQCNLGMCYHYGYGVKINCGEAVKWYQKAAKQGYSIAQYNLGACYYFGRGVKTNYDEAVKWYQKAVDQGFALAQHSLGVCYYNGHGVKENYLESMKWYHKAAEQGIDAYYDLGWYYYWGKGVAQDYKKAVEYFQKAADQGNLDAHNELGLCYWNSWGVTKDLKKAAEYFQKAADQGYETAQDNLKKLLISYPYLKSSVTNNPKSFFSSSKSQETPSSQNSFNYQP